jgi:hypothetical protein
MVPTDAAAKSNTMYTVTLEHKTAYISVCAMGVDSSWHAESGKIPVDLLRSSSSNDASDSISDEFSDMPVGSGE